jgi:hypothetical protein
MYIYRAVCQDECMTTTQQQAISNLAEMLASKVNTAMDNGATEDEAIVAVRGLWVGYLLEGDEDDSLRSYLTALTGATR